MNQSRKIVLSEKDLETEYGLKRGTWRNMRSQGRGPLYFKMGRKILYRRQDVEAFLFSCPVLTRDARDLE